MFNQMKAVQNKNTPNFFDLFRRYRRKWGYIATVKEGDIPREGVEVKYLNGHPPKRREKDNRSQRPRRWR